ncbi:thioredoxin domain protein [Haloprofundus marisrubri]|uniref:Thioredoxin domain protein n=1 Tax=Haloprofundus marisrubri TaxID=1514971 RepID=A0A0W1R7Z9_9EURY|nr:thioredoxin domain protein [Haloprofundus marisrubri]
MDDETRIEWREWGPAAFAEAADAEQPLLLSLSATWCAGCHEMDAETYAEPRIAANVNDDFVPVRVDVDRHPCVRERYNMGGFPSTVFVTPSGGVISGAGYLGPEGMRQVLDSVRETWAERGGDAGRIPRALADDPTPVGELSPAIEAHLAGQLGEKYDEVHAGWGDDAKFPLPRTVEFALKREREQALRTLDAVRDHLFDDVSGGFFRYTSGRDWSGVHHEKLLDTNAALVRAFANGYLYTGDDAYRRPAKRTIDFLTDDLWTGVAVGGSVGPAAGREYYALSADERAETRQPRVDLTAFAGGNALAAEAMLTYAGYTDDEQAKRYAERVLDFLEAELVDEDGAVTHFRAGDDVGESLLLGDHARVVAAFTRAQQVLGWGLDVAESVANRAIAELYEDESFIDGPREGPGLLDRPFRPLDDNVEMASALCDLAVLTGDARYRDVARETIEAFAGAADRIGVQAADYGAVAARLCGDPLVVAVADDPGSDLHRAALRVADHEKVVVPNAGSVLTDREFESGTATVLVGETARSAATPDELMTQVSAATRRLGTNN